MNAVWTEVEYIPAEGPDFGRLSDTGITAARLRLVVGKAEVGRIIWFADEGPYYAITQVRRLGPVMHLPFAKRLVEQWGVADVLAYPTAGNA